MYCVAFFTNLQFIKKDITRHTKENQIHQKIISQPQLLIKLWQAN